jgi:hypothetical protein
MGIPVGNTVGVSSGNVANANAVATLAAVPNKVNYLSTVRMTAVGATPLVLEWDPPLQSTAPNTAIVCTLPALGAGNTNAAVSASGFTV